MILLVFCVSFLCFLSFYCFYLSRVYIATPCHIHIYTLTRIYVYKYIYIFLSLYTYLSMCARVYVYVNKQSRTYIRHLRFRMKDHVEKREVLPHIHVKRVTHRSHVCIPYVILEPVHTCIFGRKKLHESQEKNQVTLPVSRVVITRDTQTERPSFFLLTTCVDFCLLSFCRSHFTSYFIL